MNYVAGTPNPTTIAVYDSTHTLIESYNLTFLTGATTNGGLFLGFQESTPIISCFTLTDNDIGVTNLTLSASVPEPATVWLLLGGLAVSIGWWHRRKAA